jgi:hypothetical protein
MSETKIGISNVKIVVAAVATFGSAAAAIMADGKVGLTDFPAIMKLTTDIGLIAHLDIKSLLPEIGDLDAEEMNELVQVFDANFKLPDMPTIEAKVEAGLAATLKAVDAVKFIINLVKV